MKHIHPSGAEPHDHGAAQQPFDNAERFARQLDAPGRDAWQKPGQVLQALALPRDATVVEIGAGTGYFTVRLAEHLPAGRVIALESAPPMAAYLQQRIQAAGLTNVEVRLSPPHGALPLSEPVDLILCVDSYHHITGRVAFFAQLAPQLKPTGKLVILDRAASAPEGPPPEHRTPPHVVIGEMQEAGFRLVQKLDLLLPYQFYLAFAPAHASG